MKNKNRIPFILLFVMILSILGSFCFNYLYKSYQNLYWLKFLFNFVAFEMLIFHITPPFATFITFIVVNTNKNYYENCWFRLSLFEKKLYKKLNIKKLKKKIMSYDDTLFSMEKNYSLIIRNMTQAEIVHETIFLTSFIPLFFHNLFPYPVLVAFLCFFFAILHIPFIVTQRFNRPRVVTLMMNFSD